MSCLPARPGWRPLTRACRGLPALRSHVRPNASPAVEHPCCVGVGHVGASMTESSDAGWIFWDLLTSPVLSLLPSHSPALAQAAHPCLPKTTIRTHRVILASSTLLQVSCSPCRTHHALKLTVLPRRIRRRLWRSIWRTSSFAGYPLSPISHIFRNF